MHQGVAYLLDYVLVELGLGPCYDEVYLLAEFPAYVPHDSPMGTILTLMALSLISSTRRSIIDEDSCSALSPILCACWSIDAPDMTSSPTRFMSESSFEASILTVAASFAATTLFFFCFSRAASISSG